MADTRPAGSTVTIRRLLSSQRSTWLSVAFAVVGAVAVAGWGLATQTGTNRVMAGLVALAVLVLVAGAAWRRTWVDTADGTLNQSVVGIRTRRVVWAQATTVDLERNRAGQLAQLSPGPHVPSPQPVHEPQSLRQLVQVSPLVLLHLLSPHEHAQSWAHEPQVSPALHVPSPHTAHAPQSCGHVPHASPCSQTWLPQ